MRPITFLSIGILGLALGTTFGFAHEKTPGSAKNDPTAACMDMMHGAAITEEGQNAMREFMQSDRAPQAMANMMEMARRMGNGDVMLGMTRMMEMMGGTGGGMMSGQGMMSPGH
ncbi:MAG: hypothetical protein ACREJ9_13480 [Candidatus Rokuibacteriota bacterium]